ncbi:MULTISPECIES: type II toxin-antitoxin system RelE family toxin [Photorhabdus]|uniref:Type II toxin-antitoxin system RelE/ParE family toxin n=2 Tax=Photorhabdus TaxID=29487 RepID=A0A329X066_9GAMM|nr:MULTISPECIES: type II toxin-antitoxin system RelE/ParE family toxin [Photorhabdus]MCC8374156.1 type II toxin-antitoxin system RelE/ParE family toxin [Photorhabdus bodei]MCT8352105.1 type II toxin-antitoxin system RelE/ParE family toxin [Photorhabdus kayaii]MDB6370027.1 type II toxin-antitoxin system RelE/ParE family toxin [Photorhabdus bodei]MDB6374191.1 type II toxin-antitoxin system RelE/ParE family toxin [Photorhabdus bodei]NDK98278.1 type II toxin-antitoxin system RelE/ParE family toxin
MIKVVWSGRAAKQLAKIDIRYQKAIYKKVSELESFPIVQLDITKLSGSKNQYRLRVGDYRILFDVINGEPVIIEVKEVKRRQTNTY